MPESYGVIAVEARLFSPKHNLFVAKEKYRLKVHFMFTEWALRRKNVDYLPVELQTKRLKHLEALHDYWTTGQFPLNTRHAKVVPLISDEAGTLCGMAHIVYEDGQHQLIHDLNCNDNTIRISQDIGGALGEWIDTSGLTKAEAKQIQPSYGSCGSLNDKQCMGEQAQAHSYFRPMMIALGLLFFVSEFLIFRLISSIVTKRKIEALILTFILCALVFGVFGMTLYNLGIQMGWWY
jgi:hypothetical protein